MNLLALRILEAEVPSDFPESEVVLREPDGTPCAYGWTADGDYWLDFPDVGRFRFAPGSKSMVAFPEPAATPELVTDAYHNAALPLALQALGLEAVHASAVRTPAGVAAFCAMSGTGKTTIACGMAQRGYPLWADDAVVFEERGSDRRVVAHPLPFKMNLREESLRFLAPATDLAAADRASRDCSPLATVLLLERSTSGAASGNAVEIERLSLADAFAALLPHGYRFTLSDPERKRRTVESYLRLVAGVPVVRARFAPGFEHLEQVLDGIERVLRERE